MTARSGPQKWKGRRPIGSGTSGETANAGGCEDTGGESASARIVRAVRAECNTPAHPSLAVIDDGEVA